ncbi:hypothetical protein HDV05_005605 [Chytridiales sp. JEL 0842]|nr:hypothetical protein HDV05_005605 [Chytridiales sp. JEL 0842]
MYGHITVRFYLQVEEEEPIYKAAQLAHVNGVETVAKKLATMARLSIHNFVNTIHDSVHKAGNSNTASPEDYQLRVQDWLEKINHLVKAGLFDIMKIRLGQKKNTELESLKIGMMKAMQNRTIYNPSAQTNSHELQQTTAKKASVGGGMGKVEKVKKVETKGGFKSNTKFSKDKEKWINAIIAKEQSSNFSNKNNPNSKNFEKRKSSDGGEQAKRAKTGGSRIINSEESDSDVQFAKAARSGNFSKTKIPGRDTPEIAISG